MSIWNRIREYARLVVFSNTLFSLAFGLIAIFLASPGGLPDAGTLLLVLVALLAGRTGANAFNRLADSDIDGRNPRTADRHLPAHTLSEREVWLFTLACLGLLTLAAALLRPLCLLLLPVVVGLIVLYSYSKRFTWLCHLILGAASAAAPVGVFVAISGGVGFRGWLLALLNMFWVAGFDIIYAMQDMDFDRKEGLYSIPAAFGPGAALRASALLHVLAMFCLVALGVFCALPFPAWLGIAAACALTLLQHRLARAATHKREFASMTLSRVVSLVLLLVFAGSWTWSF